MALFDKEKLKNIATDAAAKTRERTIGAYEEAKAEKAAREEAGLLPDETTPKLEYKGGHPAFPKEKDCKITARPDDMIISIGSKEAHIEYRYITGIRLETQEQLGKRVTATRLLAIGVFAFAFKKKTKDVEQYLTIDYSEVDDIENTIVIGGKNIGEAYSIIYDRYVIYKSQNSDAAASDSGVASAADPYEELKKAKELLDMGIITLEEFESRKKHLLNL